jgi:portal protein
MPKRKREKIDGRFDLKSAASPRRSTEPPRQELDDDFIGTAIKRADAAYRAAKDNIDAAYEDLQFLAGDQWPEYAKAARRDGPMLTINRLPQFVQQVTGDIELGRPAIRVKPTGNGATMELAEILRGMIRYIENRSMAKAAYAVAADSQVACGIGHLQVVGEFADDSTFNQELRIAQVDDGVGVLWDPAARLPTREDAQFCFVPVDVPHDEFKARWPDVPLTDFNTYDRAYSSYWHGNELVRVAVYWEKRETMRQLALYPDGKIEDLTDADASEVAEAEQRGAKLRERKGYKIFRSLITLGHVLEEAEEWPGLLIPVIPLIGKEIRVGRKITRYGMVRFAKDPQIMYNFSRTQQAELIGLAPKSPWLGTEKNFENHLDVWQSANTARHPFLPYTPDPSNGYAPPQRVAPPVTSPGLSELVRLGDNDMKAVTGLYDASLGARSNETSGVAIEARERQGDVGTVRYLSNFGIAVQQVGRVLVDLIPHYYDTEREVQILDEKGEARTVVINKAVAAPVLAADGDQPIELPIDVLGEDGELHGLPTTTRLNIDGEPRRYVNDLTIGSYSVVLDHGPSFSTKREETRAAMESFIKAAPQIAPLVLDLYAKAQDWPLAQEIAERIEATLPPPVKAIIDRERAAKAGVPLPPPGMAPPGAPPMPPAAAPPMPPPNPVALAQQQAELVKAKAAADTAIANAQRAAIERDLKALELTAKRAAVTGHGARPAAAQSGPAVPKAQQDG